MAWPLTPIQTFIANVTRWTASFANQVQSGVNGLVAATFSLAAVVVDGTGGNVVVPTPGTATVSASAVGTSQPTPAIAGKGVLYKDSVVLAWGVVQSGALVAGVNVSAITHPGTGSYTVTLGTGAATLAKLCPVVTTVGENIVGSAAPSAANAFAVLTAHGQTAPSGGRVDTDFFFVVFGA